MKRNTKQLGIILIAFVAVFSFSTSVYAVSPGGTVTPGLWMKADALTPVADGTDVTSWVSSEGSLFEATSTQASHPRYKLSSDPYKYNFNPYIDFRSMKTELRGFVPTPIMSGSKGTIFAVYNKLANSQRMFSYAPVSGGNFYGLEMQQGRINTGVRAYPTVSFNETSIVGLRRGLSGTYEGFKNMESSTSSIVASSNAGTTGYFFLGTAGATAAGTPAPYTGTLSELIMYDDELSSDEFIKVSSYLAAKYGITLDQNHPTSYTSYLASDGTVFWNATSSSAYNTNITVIGRDDSTSLNQKQSKAIHTNSLVTIGLTSIEVSNASNTATFAGDKSFLAFGDNAGTLSFTTSGAPAGSQILQRKWKAKETNTVGSVMISVPDNSSTFTYKLPTEVGTMRVYFDDDGNFSNGGTVSEGMTLNGTNWESSINLFDGTYAGKEYFTFGSFLSGPSVTLVKAAGQLDPTKATTSITFLATFDRPINTGTFTCADITLGGTASYTCSSVVETSPNDGTTFNVLFAATTDGTLVPTIGGSRVQDLSGLNNSTSTAPTDNSVLVDTTGPSISTAVNSLTDGATFANPIISFSGTDINGPITYGVSVNGGPSSTTTSPYAATVNPLTSNFADITACDSLGNCSISRIYFYPAVNINAPTILASTTAITNSVITITEPSGSGFDLSFATSTLDNAVVPMSCFSDSGLTTAITQQFPGGTKIAYCRIDGGISASTTDGTRTLVVNARNTNNIVGQSSQVYTFDTTPPAITNIMSTSTNGYYKLGDQINISVSLGESVATSSTLTLNLDSGDQVTFTCSSGPCSSLAGIYTVSSTASSSDLTVSSASGNLYDALYNSTSSPYILSSINLGVNNNLVVDGIVPAAPTIVGPANNTSTSTRDFSITGTCETGTTVSIYDNGTLVPSPVVCASSSYTLVPSSLFSIGTHNFTAVQTDAAGNVSATSSVSTVTIATSNQIIINPVDVSVSEAGDSGSFTVTLSSAPVADVVVVISPFTQLTTGGNLGQKTLTFTTSNWNVPQTVVINAYNDPDVEGAHQERLEFTVTSSDSEYSGIEVSGVLVDIIDNDTRQASGGSVSSNVSSSYVTTTTSVSAKKVPPLIGGGEPGVPAEFSPYVCKRYLKEYIRYGAKNNIEEVKKLQQFLNESEGEKLVVDGVYKVSDMDAVKRFQAKYLDQIMKPWGSNVPTGYVYKTTVAKINLMMCAKDQGCPYFTKYLKSGDSDIESVRVQDFLNIIFAPTSGYPNAGLKLTKNYSSETVTAVNKFQNLYRPTVLTPWNLQTSTGRWYQSTRKAANQLMNCEEGAVRLDNGVIVK